MQRIVDSTIKGEEAIVVGGGIAGLLAGRVLSDHFSHITILDRDRFPNGPVFRKGAPQAHHLHVLLARGLEILEEFFPGIGEELVNAGAVRLQWPSDTIWLGPRGWTRRFTPGVNVISCGREVLE